jgi:murein L,D-transpeptidase YafK
MSIYPHRRALFMGAAASLFAPRFARADSWADGANALHILVEKSQRRLMLIRAERTLLSFPIALGSHPVGPKRMEGDGKTPEGRYVIDRFDAGSYFHRALHISYPNADDIRRAKAMGVDPGGKIEIHGLPPGYEKIDPKSFDKDWTDGCISVSDRAIELLWRSVGLYTPIIITA